MPPTKRRRKIRRMARNGCWSGEKEDCFWLLAQDPKKKGPKKKRWAVGEVVDETQDIDKKAARLRTMPGASEILKTVLNSIQ